MLHFSQGNGYRKLLIGDVPHLCSPIRPPPSLEQRSMTPFFPPSSFPPSRWRSRQRNGRDRKREKERERDTLFNREVKLLWSFIVAKWTTSKRFDVTMVHPIKRTHVKIAVSARYTDCLYVSSSINLPPSPLKTRAHTHTYTRLIRFSSL